jgi:WD40 repeat protein
VLRREIGKPLQSPVFSSDGTWLAALGAGTIYIWDLNERTLRVLDLPYRTDYTWTLTPDPQGRYLVLGDASGFRLIWIEDGRVQEIPHVQVSSTCAVSPDGRFIAAKYSDYSGLFPDQPFVLYDVERDSIRVFDSKPVAQLQFAPDGRLLLVRQGKLWEWDIQTGTGNLLLENVRQFALSREGRSMLTTWGGRATFHDLETGTVRELDSHGDLVSAVAFDPRGQIAITGDVTGAIRVGSIEGEEPYLLLGPRGRVSDISVDPLGRWFATVADKAIYLWEYPEGKRLHVLKHKEFVDALRLLTNFRVVENPKRPGEYRVRPDTFHGWDQLPEW